MGNVLKNPVYKNQKGKTGFDVSRTLKFTSPCGLLSPVYYDFLLPGDKVKFSTEMFSRTQPLVKPAMLQVREDVDWFFVPLNQLFQFFEDLQYNIRDVKTDYVQSSFPAMNMPNFDIKQYINAFVDDGYMDKSTDEIPDAARDLFGVPKAFNADRLMQLLGYGGWSCLRQLHVGHDDETFAIVNAFLLGAYHKIYYDVYRLTDRENNEPSLYNFDSCADTGSLSSARVKALLQMHYRAWDKDYFTNNLPSPNFTGVYELNSTVGVDAADVEEEGNGYYNYLARLIGQQNYNVDFLSRIANQSPLSSTGTIPNSVNAAPTPQINLNFNQDALNYLYAINKQQEITRRASKHFDAQTLAHYGVNVPQGISGEVFRLGSDSSNIQISDIVSTAETNEGALGQMAGKGVSYSTNKQKNFTAPCHGILMAIHSVVPECDYASIGLDKFNTKRVPSDYYQPEFDRLGMQPLFQYESIFDDVRGADPATIMGWQYRYLEYKLKHNVAALGFLDTDVSHYTAFRDFKLYNDDQTLDARPTLYNYLIDPDYLGNCFEVSYVFDSDHELVSRQTAYARDPFIHMFRFHVFKSSIMSTYGLPQI